MLCCFKSSILIFVLLFDSICANEYCKLCKKGSHTLCRYKEGPSDKCTEYKKPDFSTSVKKYIVDIHNDIRNHIASGQEIRGALGRQPAASNMNSLQWDNELADIAQRWADQCIGLNEEFQHDQCRKTSRFEVGQNVLTAVTPTFNVPEIAILILNWYKQVEDVLPSDIETFSGIQRGKYLIGQYTQLVWAETRFVGCGMSTFRNRNTNDTKAKFLHRLVCNYGPRGNMIGGSVYKRGTPCSRCPYGRCDLIRTSLCRGFEEFYNPLGKHDKDKISSKDNSLFHIEMPISLFNTLSLGYILKNNLSDVINNALLNVNVHLGLNERTNDEYEPNNAEKIHLYRTLAALASILPHFNLSEFERNYENRTGPMYDEVALKKVPNILYHDTSKKIFNTHVYDLENGQVIVDDCRHHMDQCQYEDDEMSTNAPSTGDIALPNNMVYRKIKGIWFHGRCRCDYVFRSKADYINRVNYVVILLVFCLYILRYTYD